MSAGARLLAACVAVVALQSGVLPGTAEAAAPGDLDSTFGTSGKVISDITEDNDRATGVATQADGKIVVVSDTSIVRYTRGGVLDTGFDGDAKVQPIIRPRDIAIQPNGKIVVAGDDPLGGFALARYNRGGSLDTGFGTDGKVVTDFPPPTFSEAYGARATRIVIQPDGKLVAGGIAQSYAFGSYSSALAIARYDSNGAPDTSFGDPGYGAGKTFVGLGATYSGPADSGLALQADGKIVLATTDANRDFYLVRLIADGSSLDSSFGEGTGQVRTNFATSPEGDSSDIANDVGIQNGKILAAGATVDVAGHFDFALARYGSDGALDPGFGGDGKVVTDLGESDATDPKPDESIDRLAIQDDGKIVAAGCAGSSPDGFSCQGYGTGDFGLARYEPDGRLDTAFGAAGTVTTPFGDGFDSIGDVAIDPADGSILAAGQTFNGANADFALARYLGRMPPPPPDGGGGGGAGGGANPGAGADTTPGAGAGAGTTPGGGAGPVSPPSGPPAGDTQAPRVGFGGRTTQPAGRLIAFTVVTDENASLTASGQVTVPAAPSASAGAARKGKVYRLASVRRKATAKKKVTFKMRLTGKALAAVKASVRRGGRSTAKIKVVATDKAGNKRTSLRTIRLTR